MTNNRKELEETIVSKILELPIESYTTYDRHGTLASNNINNLNFEIQAMRGMRDVFEIGFIATDTIIDPRTLSLEIREKFFNLTQSLISREVEVKEEKRIRDLQHVLELINS